MISNIRIYNKDLIKESLEQTDRAIKYFIDYNKGFDDADNQRDHFVPADLDVEKTNFIANSDDETNGIQKWNEKHKNEAYSIIKFYLNELGIEDDSLSKRNFILKQIDDNKSILKKLEKRKQELLTQKDQAIFQLGTGKDSRALQTTGTGRAQKPDQSMGEFEKGLAQQDNEKRQSIQFIENELNQIQLKIKEIEKDLNASNFSLKTVSYTQDFDSRINKYIRKLVAPFVVRKDKILKLSGNTDDEKQASLRGVSQNLSKIYSDYFKIGDIRARPRGEGLNDIVIPEVFVIKRLVDIASETFMNLFKDSSNLLDKEMRRNAEASLRQSAINRNIEGKPLGVNSFIDMFNPKNRATTDSSRIGEFPKLSAEDMMSFANGIRGEYANLARLLDNNSRVMYAKTIEQLKTVEDFVNENEGAITNLIKSFKNKIAKSNGNVLTDANRFFSKFGLTQLSNEDKVLFLKIPEQLNPFEEVEKFVNLCKSSRKFLVIGNQQTNSNEFNVKEPGPLFVALFRAFYSPVNGELDAKTGKLATSPAPANRKLSDLSLRDNREFLNSSWFDKVTTDLRFNTPLSKPNDIRAVIELSKFLSDSTESSSPGAKSENIPLEVLEKKPGTMPYLLKQKAIYKKAKKDFTDAIITDFKIKKTEKEQLEGKIEKSPESVSNETTQELKKLNAAFELQKQYIFKAFSPILKDYMAQRYLDTTLVETQRFLYNLINVYNKSIEEYINSYETGKSPTIEEYLLKRFELYRLNRRLDAGGEIVRTSSGGQEFYYGPKRLLHTPKSNKELGSLFDQLETFMDIRKTRRYFGDTLFITPIRGEISDQETGEVVSTNTGEETFTPEKAREMRKGTSNAVIIGSRKNKLYQAGNGKFIKDPKTGRIIKNPNYDPNSPTSRQEVPVYGKYSKGQNKRFQYEAFPSETKLKNPEIARKAMLAARKYLVSTLEEKIRDIKTSENASEEAVIDVFLTKLSNQIVDLQEQIKNEKDPIQKASLESILDSKLLKLHDFKENDGFFAKKQTHQELILELLQVVKTVLDSLNITEDELIEEIKEDISTILAKEGDAEFNEMIKIIRWAYRGQFNTIKAHLFGKFNTKDKNIPRTRNIVKTTRPHVVVVLKKLIEVCIRIILDSQEVLERKFKSSSFSEVGGNYMNVVNALQEQILSALMPYIYRVRPGRKWQSASGGWEGGEKSVGSLNIHHAANIIDPQLRALHEQNEEMLKNFAGIWELNQDPTSDTRGTAIEVAVNVVNRYLFRMKERLINIDNQIKQAEQESPVNEEKIKYLTKEKSNIHPADLLKVLSREIDHDVKQAFKNARRTMRFGESRWTWGFFDFCHKKIKDTIGHIISNSGYDITDQLWWKDLVLQKEALDLVEPLIRKRAQNTYERNSAKLAPTGNKKSFSGVSQDFKGKTNDKVGSRNISIDDPDAKKKIIEKQFREDFEKFKTDYPQYLEMLHIQMISLNETFSDSQGEDQTLELEDLIGTEELGLGYFDNDPILVESALRSVESFLENKCFKTLDDIEALSDKTNPTEDKREKQIKLNSLNESLGTLRELINENPSNCKKIFETIIGKYSSPSKIAEIISYKFFEYLYIREFVLTRLLYNQACSALEKDISSSDFKKYLNTRILQWQSRDNHLPQLVIQKNINPQDVDWITILENYMSSASEYVNYEMLENIVNQVSGGNDDVASENAGIKFNAFKKDSTSQGAVAGGDASDSSKHENSVVGRINSAEMSKYKFTNLFKYLKSSIDRQSSATSRFYEHEKILEKIDSIEKEIDSIDAQLYYNPNDKKLLDQKKKLENQLKFLENQPARNYKEINEASYRDFTKALQELKDAALIKLDFLKTFDKYSLLRLQSKIGSSIDIVFRYLLSDFREQMHKTATGEYIFKHDVYNEEQQKTIIELIKKIQNIENNKNVGAEVMFDRVFPDINSIIKHLEELNIIRSTTIQDPSKVWIPKELASKLKALADKDFEQIFAELSSREFKEKFDSTIRNSKLSNSQISSHLKGINTITKSVSASKDAADDIKNNIREELIKLANQLETMKQKEQKVEPSKKEKEDKEQKEDNKAVKKPQSTPQTPPKEEKEKEINPEFTNAMNKRHKRSEEEYIDVSSIPESQSRNTLILQKILSVVKSDIPKSNVIKFSSKDLRTQGDSEMQKQNVKRLAGFIINLSKLQGTPAGEYTIYEPEKFGQYIVTKKDETSENPKDFIAWMIPKSVISMVHTI